MNIPPQINEIRQKVLSEVFGPNLPANLKSTIIYQHLATTGGVAGGQKAAGAIDKYGIEQGTAAFAKTAKVSKFTMTQSEFQGGTLTSGISKTLPGATFAAQTAGQNPLAESLLKAKSDEFKFNVAWDNRRTRALMLRNYAGAGELEAPYVSASKTVQLAFYDLAQKLGGTGQGVVKFSEAVQKASGEDADIIKASFASFGKPFEELTAAEKTEALFSASVTKMSQTGQVERLRQSLSQQGLTGPGGEPLSGIKATRVVSDIDPLGMARMISGIKSGSKGFIYSGAAADEAAFLGKIESFAGKRFTQDIFAPFLRNIYEQDPALKGKLQFTLGEKGELFFGKAGVYRSYQPLPLEYLDEGVASAEGLGPGLAIRGGKLSAIKRAIVDIGGTRRPIPGTQEFYRVLGENLKGLQEEAIPEILQGASRRTRSATKNLFENVINRGQFNIAKSFFQFVGFGSEPSLVGEEIFKASGAVGSFRTTEGISENIRESARLELEAGQSFRGLSPYTSTKKQGIGLLGIESFYPEQFLSKKDIQKGIHHTFMIQPLEGGEVKASRRALTRAGLGQVSPVGIFPGQLNMLRTMQAQKAGVVGRITGADLGAEIIGNYIMPLLVESSADAMAEFEKYGDPTIILAGTGRRMHGPAMMRPTKGAQARLNKGQLENMLNVIAGGDYTKNQQTLDMFEALTSGKDWRGKPIKITDEIREGLKNLKIKGLKVDKFSEIITGMSFSGTDELLKIDLARAGKQNVSVVAGGMRTTLINPRKPISLPGFDKELYKMTGGFTSARIFADMNIASTQYTDLLQLASFNKEGIEKFAQQFNLNLPEGALRLEYAKAGKEEFLYAPDIARAPMSEVQSFFDRLKGKLKQAGFSEAAIEADAYERYKMIIQKKYEGNLPKIQEELSKLDQQQTKLIGYKLPFVSLARRAEEAVEITSQKKGLSLRLSLLQDIFRSQEQISGVKLQDNPFLMNLINAFESKTGETLDLSLRTTGVTSRGIGIAFKPTSPAQKALALIGAMTGRTSLKNLQKYNLPIISEQDARKMLLEGEGGLRFSLGARYTEEELKASALFGRGRPQQFAGGALIELQDEIEISIGKGKSIKTKYIPLFGTDKVSQRILGAPVGAQGTERALTRQSYGFNLLGLLQTRGTEGIKDIKAEQTFVQGITKTINTSIRGKAGLINKAFSTQKLKGSAAVRVLTKAGLSNAELLKLAGAKEATEEMFTVNISQGTLKRIFNKNQDYQKALAQIKDKGFVYGIVKPEPTHTSAHFRYVKFKLDNTLADTAKTIGKESEPYGQFSSFLTWLMNRDNDKDTVQILLQKDLPENQAEAVFKNQLKNSESEFRQFQKEIKGKQAEIKNLRDFLEEAAKDRGDLTSKGGKLYEKYIDLYADFLKFGRTPAIPYSGTYAITSAMDIIASSATDTEAAENLMRAFAVTAKGSKGSKQITAETVKSLRATLQSSLKMSVQEMNQITDLTLVGNLKQAFITKAGKFVEPSLNMMNLGYEIASQVDLKKMDINQAMELGRQRVKEYFTNLREKLRLQGQAFTGLTEEQAIQRASDIAGSVYGATIYTIASHTTPEMRHGAMAAPFRAITKDIVAGSEADIFGILKAIGVFTGEAETPEVFASLSQSQAVENNANTVRKASTEAMPTVDKAINWLTKNWKIAGIAVAGVAVARVASDMLTEDEMERPPLKSSQRLNFRPAPLPPEPMIQSQMPNVNPSSLRRPNAYVQPVNGTYNRAQYSADYSTVNTNAMSFANDNFGSISIQDSRSYNSNWQMQNIANMAGDSDFIHPYMPIV